MTCVLGWRGLRACRAGSGEAFGPPKEASRLGGIAAGTSAAGEAYVQSGCDPAWEAAWLRLVVRPAGAEGLSEETLEEARALLARGGSWPRLLSRFQSEVLLPNAHALLEPLGEEVPEGLRGPLAAAFRAHRARTMMLLAQLGGALELLSGLEVLAFKGPVLGQLIYGSSDGRAYTDLDLLVRREDRLRAEAALRAGGYEPLWPVAPGSGSALRHASAVAFCAQGQAELDLHWGLGTPLLRFELERCGLWKRARVVEVEGLALRTLGPEDTLLQVCMHAAKPDWTQWSSLADIAGLLAAEPGLNLELLWELAARTGTKRLLRVALLVAGAEAAAPLPARLRAWAGRDSVAVGVAREVGAALAGGEAASQGIAARLRRAVRLRERGQDKAHALLGAVARASEPRVGERWPLWVYPLRRPLRLWQDLRGDARPPLGGVDG